MHANWLKGSYLVEATWFAAMYGQSPEGKLLPLRLGLTADQAARNSAIGLERGKELPYCGLYEAGTEPAGVPQVFSAAGKHPDVTPVTLNSSTPGAWFRYTLDGTEPTRHAGLRLLRRHQPPPWHDA